jgi:arylsulfatase A-like enzyme
MIAVTATVAVAVAVGPCLHAADRPDGTKPAARGKPNIVFILADDIGYGDLSCYGAKLVQTPVLDRLAREGRRFTDAHSAASTCSPSRRALMTGAYSWRQQAGSAILAGDAQLSIAPGSVTLPSMLKKAGYTTGAVGKWHLGLGGPGGPAWNGEIQPGPLEIGFDYAFFFPATGDRVPCVFIENHRIVGLDPTDPIAVSYVKKIGNEPTGRENPELLNLKATHGHDNTIINGIGRIGWMSGGRMARWKDDQIADTFRQKACQFIERNKDKPFFLYFATHNIHVPRVPNARHHGKSQCGTRGDSIVELDAATGEVVATLERLKLADNTLVIFSSDNGGVMDDGYADVGNFDHPCNGLLRGYKGSLWEGGHRVPLIARWPGHIQPGSECSELVTLIDIMVTFAALTGQTLPADAAPDSLNVLPALLGLPHDRPGRDTFVAHSGGTKGPFAIRQGQWKLIQAGGARESYADANKTALAGKRARNKGSIRPFLLNLADDLRETTNLAAEHPEKVEQLQTLFEKLRDAGRSRP